MLFSRLCLLTEGLHVLLLWTWDHSGENTVPWPHQRDTRGAGHRVCFDTLLGSKYLVRVLVWLVISFRNMESSTVCWRSALLATASYPSLYPLSAPTLTSNPYVHVVYSWKVSSLELFPEDTKRIAIMIKSLGGVITHNWTYTFVCFLRVTLPHIFVVSNISW